MLERRDMTMKKTMLRVFILLIALTWIPFSSAEQTINNCPVPDNLKIIKPDGNVVPPKLALLSGIWEGNWTSSVIFIVEQIKEKEAIVVLAWAPVTARTQAGTSYAPGFVRLKCPIEQGEDGNYRIICTVKTGTNRLIQMNDPKHIRVVRDGFGTMPPEYRDSIFRKKEMK
jgi:hypothetical protein